MEYLTGLILSLAVAISAAIIGFDRERAFYPTVLIVIASYYVLFAAMGASRRALIIEIVVASGFLLSAVLGFRKNLGLIVAALIGHGIFDFVHRLFIDRCAALVARFLLGIRCASRYFLSRATDRPPELFSQPRRVRFMREYSLSDLGQPQKAYRADHLHPKI